MLYLCYVTGSAFICWHSFACMWLRANTCPALNLGPSGQFHYKQYCHRNMGLAPRGMVEVRCRPLKTVWCRRALCTCVFGLFSSQSIFIYVEHKALKTMGFVKTVNAVLEARLSPEYSTAWMGKSTDLVQCEICPTGFWENVKFCGTMKNRSVIPFSDNLYTMGTHHLNILPFFSTKEVVFI